MRLVSSFASQVAAAASTRPSKLLNRLRATLVPPPMTSLQQFRFFVLLEHSRLPGTYLSPHDALSEEQAGRSPVQRTLSGPRSRQVVHIRLPSCQGPQQVETRSEMVSTLCRQSASLTSMSQLTTQQVSVATAVRRILKPRTGR
jgi:hypothetical protein